MADESQIYYAVAKGKKCGIFLTLGQCQKQTQKVADTLFQEFKQLEDAVQFLTDNSDIIYDDILVYDKQNRCVPLVEYLAGSFVSLDEDSFKDIIVDPVLTYVAFSLDTSPAEYVNTCCVQFYTADELKRAKLLLWGKIGEDILGSNVKRRDGSSRSESEAIIMDITAAVQKLDALGKLPSFLVDPVGLHRIPKCNPSEMNSVSMCERLVQMEQRLKMVENSLSENVVKTLGMEEKVHKMTSYATVVTGRPSPSAPPPSVSPNIVAGRLSPSAPPLSVSPRQLMPPPPLPLSQTQSHPQRMYSHVINASGTRHTTGPRPAAPREASASGLMRSASQLSVTSNTSQQSGSFVFQRQDRRRQRRRAEAVVGTGPSDIIRGAPEPLRDLFVSRLEQGVTLDQIKHYTNSKNVTVHNIEKKSREDSMYLSFKVTVKVSDMDTLLQPDFWPMGVRVRRFWLPRQQHTRP